MRLIKEIPSPDFKITLFAWNNRYLIKLEQGLLEQTFKINQFDVSNEDELLQILDDEFLQKADLRFREMAQALSAARTRIS